MFFSPVEVLACVPPGVEEWISYVGLCVCIVHMNVLAKSQEFRMVDGTYDIGEERESF